MNKVWPAIAVLFFCVHSYGSTMDSLVRLLNPEIEKIEANIEELKAEIDKLPPQSTGLSGDSKGFHSFYVEDQNSPLTITIDLGASYPLDYLALFPGSTIFQGEYIKGYGFPEKFNIEVSENNSEDSYRIIYKYDYQKPYESVYPVLVTPKNIKARFVRLKISKHWRRHDNRFFSVLSEFMIFSGKRNVALHKSVKAETRALPGKWQPQYLVDGQTDWGAPISSMPSKTNGYVSKRSKTAQTDKWIMLDLGAEHDLLDVRLVPAHPFDAPANFDHGFPLNFKIETSLDPNFEKNILVADEKNFPSPGGNAVVFNHTGKARYIRVSSDLLQPVLGEERYALAFSEIQAYTSEGNAALNAKVSAKDEANFVSLKHVWNKEALVDGFNSQNELIDQLDWLLAINTKRQQTLSLFQLKSKLATEIKETGSTITYVTSGIVICLAFFLSFNIYQRKKKLKLEVEKLRTQIARDLHDDLGSRLGGIRLLSQVVLDDPDLNETTKEDLQFINNSAISAVESMREIVWLTDGKDIEAKELVEHMHTVSQETLNKLDLTWNENCISSLIIPFHFRRHLAFAFRECLGNIIKHSKATKVFIEVLANKDEFSFKVSDDGCGFDRDKVIAGNGLSNFRQRAKNINGDFEINSTPGEGTTITFKANLQV